MHADGIGIHTPSSPHHLDAPPHTGEESGFTSLLGTSDPTIWHVALASLPALTGDLPEGEPDRDLVETLRQEGERLVEAEAAVFERDLQVKTLQRS